MTATYRVDTNDLSIGLINSIKEAFKNKVVEITVTDTMDETDFLLSSDINKKNILESIQELESGKGIVFTVAQLQEKYSA